MSKLKAPALVSLASLWLRWERYEDQAALDPVTAKHVLDRTRMVSESASPAEAVVMVKLIDRMVVEWTWTKLTPADVQGTLQVRKKGSHFILCVAVLTLLARWSHSLATFNGVMPSDVYLLQGQGILN
jgi:hypothetical protein